MIHVLHTNKLREHFYTHTITERPHQQLSEYPHLHKSNNDQDPGQDRDLVWGELLKEQAAVGNQ